MGAGRKTVTYDADTGAQDQYQQFRFENSQRNLAEELGGCIFGESTCSMAGTSAPGKLHIVSVETLYCCSYTQNSH